MNVSNEIFLRNEVLTKTFLSVLVGCSPFHQDDNDKTFRKILRVEYNPIPDYVSQLANHFISKLLVFSPEGRMSLDQAAVHSWLTVNYY